MKLRRKKNNRISTIDRGRRLLVSRRDQEALEFLEGATKKYPEDAEIRLLYATLLLEFRPDDVATEAAKAIELAPDDPIILVRAGGLLLNREKYDAARSCLEHARELAKPDFILMAGLLNREGILALASDDFPLADEKLRAAVEREPTSGPFACDLVRVMAVRGRQAEAVDFIDQALPRVAEKDELERLRKKLLSDVGSA